MISIIVGTRPEIIKMSPIIRYCRDKDIEYNIIHTNQHYSYEMDRIFFENLMLPEPDYNLEVGSSTPGIQTGLMLCRIEKVFLNNRPSIVLVQGDTNSVLAGAIAASKNHIPVGHVEAGLRSFDRTMQEEVNRILTDHISDYLFVPTESSKINLEKEGINKNVFIVGNTIVDATYQNLDISMNTSTILKDLHLERNDYFLVTLHRAENVDRREKLDKILTALDNLAEVYNTPIIFPIHPRTSKMIKQFNLTSLTKKITLIPPVGYFDFLVLEKHSKLILTDSGGIQEEACILNIPCVTLRENTERPETIEVGKNILAGSEPENIANSIETMLSRPISTNNPYGDGNTGKKIVEIIAEYV